VEFLQKFRDLIEVNKKEAMIEIESCDTVEKCYDWKRKYLGKDSMIGQVLKGLHDRSTSN